jgi:imidazolonepropionase-like amidohydrolase
MGTDAGASTGRFPGYFEHMELELMVEAGLSPMEALVAATGAAAACTDLDGDLGTLEAGKWADFLVLGANPLDDIRNTKSLESVWIAGQRLPDTE